EIAFAEHEMILLHFIHQIAAGLSQPQRRPPILGWLEPRRKPLRGTIEVGRLGRIAENLVERYIGKLVFRQPPSNLGGEAVAIAPILGHVHLVDLPALRKLTRLTISQQFTVPVDWAPDESSRAAGYMKRVLQLRIG